MSVLLGVMIALVGAQRLELPARWRVGDGDVDVVDESVDDEPDIFMSWGSLDDSPEYTTVWGEPWW